MLARKSGSPLYTIVSGFFSTWLGLNVNVASPPLNSAVPSVFTVTFFRCFLTNSKVTRPVGTPPPGATGSISAVRPTALSFFFPLRTACGTRTIAVAAWLTDSAAVPDFAPRKSVPPS